MNKTIHIDLADIGLDGQWIDVRDPRFLSMRKLERWQTEAKGGTLDNERFIREFVMAWHLEDADTGTEMNDPSKDDIGGLPVAVFTAMNEHLQRFFRGEVAAAGGDRPHLRVVDGDPGGPRPAA